MAIEIAVYASLRENGIEGRDGYSFYSYSPDFPVLKSSSEIINNVSHSVYEEPAIDEWLDHDENGNIMYPSANEVQHANEKEEDSFKYNPRMFLFRPVDDMEGNKYAFVFGKQMSFDWTGVRPNNAYHYTCICDKEDIKKYPFMYADSPVVACDIKRSFFFPVDGNMKTPTMFAQPKSLEPEDDTVYAPHSAGFETIDETIIERFINSIDESDYGLNGIDILKSMFTALIDCKSNETSPSIVVADNKDNNLLWIAAITYVLPARCALDISFNSYGYRVGNYDISGVFVPELNGCKDEGGVTHYRFDRMSGSYAVYDFLQKSYAPSVRVADNEFMDMLSNAYEIDMNILSAYKKFVESETNYSKADSDYINGYYLYLLSEKKKNLECDQLALAVDFLKKYALDSRILNVLHMMINNSMYYIRDSELSSLFSEVIDLAVAKSICEKEAVEELIFSNLYSLFTDVNSRTFMDFINVEKAVQGLFGYSDEEMYMCFNKYIASETIKEMAENCSDAQRLLYILSSINVAVKNYKCNIRPGSEYYEYEKTIVGRIFTTDTVNDRENLRQIIEIELARFDSIENIFDLYNVFLRAFINKGVDSLLVLLQESMMERYFSFKEDQKKVFVSRILEDNNGDKYIKTILSAIKRIDKTADKIKEYKFLIDNYNKFVSPHLSYIVSSILECINDLNLNGIVDLLDWVYELNLQAHMLEQKDFDMFGLKILNKLYFEHEDFVYSDIDRVNKSLCRAGASMNMSNKDYNIYLAFIHVGEMKAHVEFRNMYKGLSANTIPDVREFSDKELQGYFATVAKLMCTNWTSTGELPEMFEVYKVKDSYCEELVIREMTKAFIANDKKRNRARYIINLAELCIVDKNTEYLSVILREVKRSDISYKELLHVVDSDLKILEKNHKGPDLLQGIGFEELEKLYDMINNELGQTNQSGGIKKAFDSVFSIFKGKN